MKQADEGATSSRSRRKLWLVPILAVGVLIVAALFIPVMDGPHSRQHRIEAFSVGTLGTINRLQSEYVAAHPKKGFACELPLLKSPHPVRDSPDPEEFLVTGERAGYKFAIVRCLATTNGEVLHYEITAVPVGSGVRAFCTDESGVIWYDSLGSGQNCLASRRRIE